MGFLDEKIAALEKANRLMKKADAITKDGQQDNSENRLQLKLDETIIALQQGEVVINNQIIEFELENYFENNLKLILPKKFFDEINKQLETVVFVNNDKGISILVNYFAQGMEEQPIEVLKSQLEDNFVKLGMYAETLKQETLDNLRYLCFHTPTGKGWIYNIIFYINSKGKGIVGNLNCQEKDKDTYGVLLEAMVHQVNAMLRDKQEEI